ncbi:hypothetical protein GGR57DRAFT_198360 [Xylariaceae sp. FL1272]|nr:hypothetical protein GGR57DRAFT_198360 [Xylariaceae sp. FL1272]
MALESLFDRLGPKIEDHEEETFLLFSRQIPSQNLGFVDSKAITIDLTIANNDYTIHQSPTILNRPGSTTGAVLWKITPLVSEWLASSDNLLWKSGSLDSSSCVLELGCGISGLVGLTVSPLVSRYVLTDQSYVARLVEQNIQENRMLHSKRSSKASSHKRKAKSSASTAGSPTLSFTPFDWELDQVTDSLTGSSEHSFDSVIACDCIYNTHLIKPLVSTCIDACRLRLRDEQRSDPTLVIVAQQLRDPDIFEGWMKEFTDHFRVWRVPEDALSSELRANTGFVVHIGVLK